MENLIAKSLDNAHQFIEDRYSGQDMIINKNNIAKVDAAIADALRMGAVEIRRLDKLLINSPATQNAELCKVKDIISKYETEQMLSYDPSNKTNSFVMQSVDFQRIVKAMESISDEPAGQPTTQPTNLTEDIKFDRAWQQRMQQAIEELYKEKRERLNFYDGQIDGLQQALNIVAKAADESEHG